MQKAALGIGLMFEKEVDLYYIEYCLILMWPGNEGYRRSTFFVVLNFCEILYELGTQPNFPGVLNSWFRVTHYIVYICNAIIHEY